jgi:hypothetical protein
MAKDFNIYQWRRQQLVENQVSEEKKSWKKDFKEIMDANDLTKGEIMDFISVYFRDEKDKPTMVSVNENEEEKTIRDIKWDDVAGLSLPTNDYGTYMYMDNRDMFDDKWRERTLQSWKDSLVRQFPDALDFKVVIDKSQPSYDQVKILNKDYIDTINRKGDFQQAEFDKYSRRSK